MSEILIKKEDMEILTEFDNKLVNIYKEKNLQGGVPHIMNHLKSIYDKYSPTKYSGCCGNSGKWLQRLAFWYVKTKTTNELSMQVAKQVIQEPKQLIVEPQTIGNIIKNKPGRPKKNK